MSGRFFWAHFFTYFHDNCHRRDRLGSCFSIENNFVFFFLSIGFYASWLFQRFPVTLTFFSFPVIPPFLIQNTFKRVFTWRSDDSAEDVFKSLLSDVC